MGRDREVIGGREPDAGVAVVDGEDGVVGIQSLEF
jgi:hypothetical protein